METQQNNQPKNRSGLPILFAGILIGGILTFLAENYISPNFENKKPEQEIKETKRYSPGETLDPAYSPGIEQKASEQAEKALKDAQQQEVKKVPFDKTSVLGEKTKKVVHQKTAAEKQREIDVKDSLETAKEITKGIYDGLSEKIKNGEFRNIKGTKRESD
jgi:hypothetical protein